MGLYEDRILPRLIDWLLGGQAFHRLRAEACADLHGEVVEVGFGSGLNVPHYPATITRVRAVDPATLGRKLAAKRVAASSIPVEYIGLDGEVLPLEDNSVDAVLVTFTLCTIPNVQQALDEIRRVLRPGGVLRFVEHGRSPDEKVARWQDRITPIQRRVAGGCRLNRSIPELIADSGLTLERLDEGYVGVPRSYTYMFRGEARKPVSEQV